MKTQAKIRITLPTKKNFTIGAGDLIKQVTDYLGIKQCKSCKRRQETLNKWLVIRGRGK